jgi:hypothetical protein
MQIKGLRLKGGNPFFHCRTGASRQQRALWQRKKIIVFSPAMVQKKK